MEKIPRRDNSVIASQTLEVVRISSSTTNGWEDLRDRAPWAASVLSITWYYLGGRLADDHPLDMSKDEKISNYKSCMEVHHLHNQMSKGGEESCFGCTCPLIAPLCFVPWSLSAPQLISEPYALSQPVNPQQSWTTASLRLVSVQIKFGGPGIMIFQAVWASAQRHHRYESSLHGQNWPCQPFQK